jgi:hypothetical protein
MVSYGHLNYRGTTVERPQDLEQLLNAEGFEL